MNMIYGCILSLLFWIFFNLNYCADNSIINKKRVVLIGIDGLLKKCMNESNASSFEYFKKQGAYTINARTIIETTSAPGWVSILCGMNSEESGIFDNSWIAPWMFGKEAKISSVTNNEPTPCVFSELKRNKPNIITKATWDWNWFINIGNISMPGSIDKEYFCNPLPERDITTYDICDKEMVDNAIESIQEDFEFLFVYFISVDYAGHLFNFCSKEYIDRISNINNYIEMIIQSLKNKKMLENTYVILSTDHGASFMKKWHGFQDDDNLITPFYIIGPGIKKNYEIQKYIENKDIAPTILHMFGYKPNILWSGNLIDEIFVDESLRMNDINISSINKLKFLYQ